MFKLPPPLAPNYTTPSPSNITNTNSAHVIDSSVLIIGIVDFIIYYFN